MVTSQKRIVHIDVLIKTLSLNAAIIGVAAYNNHKLKREASRAVSSDQPVESLPLVSSQTSNK